MPPTIDYASPVVQSATAEDRSPQRYFVYGLDLQTMRTIRLDVEARGLTNLAYILKSEGYMAELVIVAPDRSVSEPPPLATYVANARMEGNHALLSRLEKLEESAAEGVPYKLIQRVDRPAELRRTSLDSRILVKTRNGFTTVGTEGKLPGEARQRLALWGLSCGSINLALGVLVIGGMLVLRNALPGVAVLVMAVAFVFYVVPGGIMLVMGLDRWKNKNWVPIVAMIVGGGMILVVLLGLSSSIFVATTTNPVNVIVLLALLLMYGRYLSVACAAVRG